jgi:hypothetical protein
MAASAIILLFLRWEQRSSVSDWASKNVRSASVVWSPSVAESTDTSYFTAEEEDEEPEETEPSVSWSPSVDESTETSYFITEEEAEDPAEEEAEEAAEDDDEDLEETVGSESVALSSSDTESTDTSSFTTGKEDEEPEENRPPLDTLIGDLDKNITDDVEFLLDFAIIGHAKTATTFTLNWLASHDEIQMYDHEIHSLHMGKPAEMVDQLYKLPAGSKYKRGYKAPNDIISIEAMDSIAKYWPNSKLIVGIRHPVSWFESFYNYRLQKGYTMPPALSLIGKCNTDSYRVCTEGANFHLNLNLLGKTNQTSPEEKKLLTPSPSNVPIRPLHNQVFVYDISQLHDEDEARSDKYRHDLGNFLGLNHELSPIVNKAKNRKKDFDICEDRYRPLRRVLMDIAQPASEWIRTYFMQSPDVVISSPRYFNELLLEWMEDPCDKQSDENDPERRRLSF